MLIGATGDHLEEAPTNPLTTLPDPEDLYLPTAIGVLGARLPRPALR